MLSSAASIAGKPLQQQRCAARQPAGRRLLTTRALFGFLAPAKPKVNPNKAKELVTELLLLTERTDGGLNASSAKRQQIEELVEELEAYCPRNPLRSPLLYGDYEVLYTSKPQTAGGPFRSPLGRTIFPGQRALQSLQAPNICINEVSYKTLGFVPGSARQEGEFVPINSNTFQLVFPELDGKAKGGPPQRNIQIVYLDERVRVARFLPPEDDEDAEPIFFVFRRLAEEEQEEQEVEADRGLLQNLGTRKIKAAAQQAQEAAPARRNVLGTQLLGRKDGLATIAEKRYAQQKGGSRDTGSVARGGSGTVARGATTNRKSREEIAAERAAARAAAEEERRAAREAAAAAKAAAEEERRQRQAQLETERARVAQLKEDARKQLAELQAEAVEAVDEAKAAAAAAKEAEKASSAMLQQASQARGVIEDAVSAATLAVQQVEALKQQEKEAADALADARNALKQLQTAGRRR